MFADDSEDDEDGDKLPQTPAADPIIEAKVKSLKNYSKLIKKMLKLWTGFD